MNTATVSLAVTPVVVSTFFKHYINRKETRQKPTSHLSYHEGLHLIRRFLSFASERTVEELQSFTSQWVPHPQWVRVDEVEIPQAELSRAATLLQEQLGPEGIRRVGGREWWQWRKPKAPLKAEWIEMKSDYYERKKNAEHGNRVMLYVHGGAYFFGSVDEHRYQIQRHARKLKARALAPRYRLAPQFPFPCGLQDCLATYLHLLAYQEPSTIILAGDSAGAGMILSMLVTIRDRGIPLPAGAVLISPWVDLTHSFPSVAGDCPLDYIPASGFHHKPSRAWPPPDEDELAELKKVAVHQKKNMDASSDGPSDLKDGTPSVEDVAEKTHRLSLVVDGERVDIKEQIQMYTTNELLAHPLVSPVLQPTLGGLCPLFIMVGGGEMLRDEQVYIAHKCADPERYLPPEAVMDEHAWEQVRKYPPTDVHLQVWDDLCHVGPTLSFTRPAKYQYRAIAQFASWALSRAQKKDVDILDDDEISVISSNSSTASEQGDGEGGKRKKPKPKKTKKQTASESNKRTGTDITASTQNSTAVGRPGDPLPPFEQHMIRQGVTAHGVLYPLPPAESLPACTMDRNLVGVIKVGPVRKWLAHKRKWDTKFASTKRKVHEKRVKDLQVGYEVFPEGDVPPPSALAGRRKIGGDELDKKRKEKSYGMALWGVWGSKHDQMTMKREAEAGPGGAKTTGAAAGKGGEGARQFSDLQLQEGEAGVDEKKKEEEKKMNQEEKRRSGSGSREKSGENVVVQVEDHHAQPPVTDDQEDTPIAKLLAFRRGQRRVSNDGNGPDADGKTPQQQDGKQDDPNAPATSQVGAGAGAPETGVTGKRPIVDGLCVPFTLTKDDCSASMMTLRSAPQSSYGLPDGDGDGDDNRSEAATISRLSNNPGDRASTISRLSNNPAGDRASTASLFATPMATPALTVPGNSDSRPVLERFVTADEVPARDV